MSDKRRILIPRIPLNGVYIDIKEAINEEFGISDIVVMERDILLSEITKRLSTVQYTNILIDEELYKTKSVSFYTNVFGVQYTIEVMCVYFNNTEGYESSLEHIAYDAYTDKDRHIISIRCAKVYKDFVPSTFDDSVQHELHHIFQYTKNVDTVTKKNLSKELYSNCIRFMNGGSRNPFTTKIAHGLYFCYETEQEAFVNGLDAELSSTPSSTERHIRLMRSEAYSSINVIDEAIGILDAPRKVFDAPLFAAFGKTRQQLKDILINGRKSMIRKIGRVVVKNDSIKENIHYGSSSFAITLRDRVTK